MHIQGSSYIWMCNTEPQQISRVVHLCARNLRTHVSAGVGYVAHRVVLYM